MKEKIIVIVTILSIVFLSISCSMQDGLEETIKASAPEAITRGYSNNLMKVVGPTYEGIQWKQDKETKKYLYCHVWSFKVTNISTFTYAPWYLYTSILVNGAYKTITLGGTNLLPGKTEIHRAWWSTAWGKQTPVYWTRVYF